MGAHKERAEGLVAALHELGPGEGVSLAYREMQVNLAQINPLDDKRFGDQGYLKSAPEGVAAQAGWGRLTSAHGIVNVSFADVENNWRQSHTDFPPWLPSLNPVVGLRLGTEDARNHGASVLSVVMAVDNKFHIIGLATGLPQGSIRLASVNNGQSVNNVANAIATVVQRGGMVAGDVLLIEVEREGRPVELDCADFAAIYHAVNTNGIIVVEAAGNGNVDLNVAYQNYRCSFEAIQNASDSGAILVGAGHSLVEDSNHPAGHRRWTRDPKASNYGSRVNCYAWGERVLTLRGTNTVADFNATSAAAAVIAGMAILVQSLWKASHGGVPLSPTRMRDVLSNPDNGTPQYPTQLERQNNMLKAIGSMPDLARVLPALGL